ncbi:MAG: ABC transporter ATP-binding protein, partial [Merismopedia sp. SIO2A8]|nr:ABC transporter ATP-binding protein [Merismopedia sp. SIO2A8]
TLDGIDVVSTTSWFPPEKRGIGMVFQDYALFPHLTVGQNVAFGLKPRRRGVFGFIPSSPQRIQQRVADVLALVGLEGMEGRYPHQLSGGQQQRVALARALAPNPQMVLLDEPLSNLDAKVRLQLRQDLRDILKTAGATGIFVTHDQEEALSICDRVAVMRHGHLEQIGTPEALYQQPASRFVAEFVVQANFLHAYADGGQWDTELGYFPKTDLATGQDTQPLNCVDFRGDHHYPDKLHRDNGDLQMELMVRQEDVNLTVDQTSNIVVRDRQFLGRENRYCLQLPSGRTLVARVPADILYEVGTKVKVAIAPDAIQAFPHLVAPTPIVRQPVATAKTSH